MKFNKSDFAKDIKLSRKEKGLNCRKAATEIGISPATLSRIENEKFTPDVWTLYKCCKWMDLEDYMKVYFE